MPRMRLLTSNGQRQHYRGQGKPKCGVGMCFCPGCDGAFPHVPYPCFPLYSLGHQAVTSAHGQRGASQDLRTWSRA